MLYGFHVFRDVKNVLDRLWRQEEQLCLNHRKNWKIWNFSIFFNFCIFSQGFLINHFVSVGAVENVLGIQNLFFFLHLTDSTSILLIFCYLFEAIEKNLGPIRKHENENVFYQKIENHKKKWKISNFSIFLVEKRLIFLSPQWAQKLF